MVRRSNEVASSSCVEGSSLTHVMEIGRINFLPLETYGSSQATG
jgi:hypothetical protein